MYNALRTILGEFDISANSLPLPKYPTFGYGVPRTLRMVGNFLSEAHGMDLAFRIT